jgi:LytS/YehU family sensor histidine kinase
VLGLLALMIIFFYKRRVRKIRQAEELKTLQNTRMAELEQVALRSQMNPHFIFNCLTSVQQLIINNQKEQANEYLVKFSRLIRKTLDFSSRTFISVFEKVTYLGEYVELEQFRIPGSFKFNIIIDSSIDQDRTLIPNMMLQPVIENAIRHGIRHRVDHSGLITLIMTLEDKIIKCVITDNGLGRRFNASLNSVHLNNHKSFGMEILYKRLQGFFKSEQPAEIFEVQDLYNEDGTAAGTSVKISLPVKFEQ